MNKYLRNHKEPVTEAIEQLWAFSHLTPANYTEIKKYVAELEDVVKTLKFSLEIQEGDINLLKENLRKAEAELNWFNDYVQIYTNTRVSIHTMQDIVCFKLYQKSAECKEFHEDGFFAMKELVEQINCFYDIKNPYKPSNKIAYGWNFAMDKKYFRKYLFACIRNYLQKNDVEFKASDLQKICYLKDLEEGDI